MKYLHYRYYLILYDQLNVLIEFLILDMNELNLPFENFHITFDIHHYYCLEIHDQQVVQYLMMSSHQQNLLPLKFILISNLQLEFQHPPQDPN
jgi:hypothetical protein